MDTNTDTLTPGTPVVYNGSLDWLHGMVGRVIGQDPLSGRYHVNLYARDPMDDVPLAQVSRLSLTPLY